MGESLGLCYVLGYWKRRRERDSNPCSLDEDSFHSLSKWIIRSSFKAFEMMLDNLCMISAFVVYHLLKHWNQTMVMICHGLSSTSIDTWEDITSIRIIIITYNNALSSSHWNNYHSPNHPSSRVVCVSGASESFNHTAKTINCNGMHTNQLWLSGLANSVVLSWRLKAKLLEGSIFAGFQDCLRYQYRNRLIMLNII